MTGILGWVRGVEGTDGCAGTPSRLLIRGRGALFSLILLTGPLLGCWGDEVIEEPTPLYGDVPIEYPLDLWDADVEGVTLLRVRVTNMGVVDSVEVVEGSGYPAFDAAAVRGAFELRYSPARKNGERTTVWAKVPVHFRKENS
jgi:TonB family protein